MTDTATLFALYRGMGTAAAAAAAAGTVTATSPDRDRWRATVRAYLAACYPVALMTRLFAGSGGWRHMARASLFQHWSHAPFIRPTDEGALRAFLIDAPTFGAFDTWVSVHVGALVRPDPTTGQPSATLERELVLDLDLNAWEEKRAAGIRNGLLCTCAAGGDAKACCRRCFCLVELADVVFEHVLRDTLTQQPPLWVFSGGKGAHAWFGAPQVRALSGEAREQLLKEFAGWQDARALDRLAAAAAAQSSSSSPSTVIDRLLEAWRAIVVKRERVFESATARDWLKRWVTVPAAGHGDSAAFWAAVEAANPRAKVVRVVLEVALPVVDLELLKGASHLAKTPFSMHASTVNIALPLARDRLRQGRFDPRSDAVTATPNASAHPLFQEALKVLEQWLDLCEYD